MFGRCITKTRFQLSITILEMIETIQKKLTELEEDNRRCESEIRENRSLRKEDKMKHDELLLEVAKVKTGNQNYGN